MNELSFRENRVGNSARPR